MNVSGGQKQRLCIARAVLKAPKVLILDDSTSRRGYCHRGQNPSGAGPGLPGTTKIIIAQRVTSVRTADQIIILEDGKIDAVGTHDELLKTNDFYRGLYESQQKGRWSNSVGIHSILEIDLIFLSARGGNSAKLEALLCRKQ